MIMFHGLLYVSVTPTFSLLFEYLEAFRGTDAVPSAWKALPHPVFFWVSLTIF